jgi:hypothetical protein
MEGVVVFVSVVSETLPCRGAEVVAEDGCVFVDVLFVYV